MATNSVRATTSVTNNISVSAQTGGNRPNGKTVTTGSSEASVFSETTVNGEAVQKIDKHVISDNGEPIIINQEFHYDSDSGSVSVNASSSPDNEKSVITGSKKPLKSGIQKNYPKADDEQYGIVAWFKKIINYVFSLFKF